MHIGFFKNIEQYLKEKGDKKILVLNDSYFSYNPTNQNAKISKYLDTLQNNKNIEILRLHKIYLTISSSLDDSIFGRKHGAGEGIRTLDFNLGKVALYP